MFFVFDVESIGLHGEGYAVGFVVVDSNGNELESGKFSCNPDECRGPIDARKWVKKNCPPIAETHESVTGVRQAFWNKWIYWKDRGAIAAADCPWPVEARFLADCVDDARPVVRGGMAECDRDWAGPYPLLDVASAMFAKGTDPMAKQDRLESELPEHDPLADARQSARLLICHLDK